MVLPTVAEVSPHSIGGIEHACKSGLAMHFVERFIEQYQLGIGGTYR
jgi:hypothetical protein